jgi:hypothetical protein
MNSSLGARGPTGGIVVEGGEEMDEDRTRTWYVQDTTVSVITASECHRV